MKLYYMPASCSLSPHIIINELGLDVELVKVDHNTHRTEAGEDYFAINPHGHVPTLQFDDGTVLREGTAIVQYLADQKPERGLVPANGTYERYQLQEMLGFLSTEIHKGFIPLLYARLAGNYVETARPKLEKRFAWLNEHLASRDFLMGNTFTVADAYLFVLTSWGQAPWLKSYYKTSIHFDQLQHLEAWYGRMRERDAVRRSILAEGLAF
ncbi:glutathione transferase GstA [Phyllobacterium sp. NPDC097923]|uniref:glutathione transferase GstA n=1 Tax=Phyllobacterium sp. NPDC097923 TaxID=3364404 RepID=UPI00383BF30F